MKATMAGHGNLEHKKELPAPRNSYTEVDGYCVHCEQPYFGGPYGRWGEVEGTCSPSCEKAEAEKPRFNPPPD